MAIDVNAQFAATREQQIGGAAYWQGLRDAGQLRNLGNGRYQINKPGDWDNGEVVTLNFQEDANGRFVPETGLEVVDGRVSLYAAEEFGPIWHKLGTTVPQGLSSLEEVLKLANADFEVCKAPAQFTGPDGIIRTADGSFITYRTDTMQALGSVGNIYTVVQAREALGFVENLVRDQSLRALFDLHDEIRWASCGVSEGGKRVFACLRMPDSVVIDPSGLQDHVQFYIVITNSYDGSSPVKVMVTPWRPVCGNTERFALRDAAYLHKFRHTTNWADRVADARKALGLTVKYSKEFMTEETVLVETPASNATFEEIVAGLFSIQEEAELSKRALTLQKNRQDGLMEGWAIERKRVGGNLYAAERAMTWFVDNQATVRPGKRGDEAIARAEGLISDKDGGLKTAIHKTLMAVAASR